MTSDSKWALEKYSETALKGKALSETCNAMLIHRTAYQHSGRNTQIRGSISSFSAYEQIYQSNYHYSNLFDENNIALMSDYSQVSFCTFVGIIRNTSQRSSAP